MQTPHQLLVAKNIVEDRHAKEISQLWHALRIPLSCNVEDNTTITWGGEARSTRFPSCPGLPTNFEGALGYFPAEWCFTVVHG